MSLSSTCNSHINSRLFLNSDDLPKKKGEKEINVRMLGTHQICTRRENIYDSSYDEMWWRPPACKQVNNSCVKQHLKHLPLAFRQIATREMKFLDIPWDVRRLQDPTANWLLFRVRSLNDSKQNFFFDTFAREKIFNFHNFSSIYKQISINFYVRNYFSFLLIIYDDGILHRIVLSLYLGHITMLATC